MGLDWIPMQKPKQGFEKRFEEIYLIITGVKEGGSGWFEKLLGRKKKTKEELLEEWASISESPFETIKAPLVGRDKLADDWISAKYDSLTLHSKPSKDDFLKEYRGYYVVELATELNGLAVYLSGHEDRHVFRAEFFKDCEELIGADLFEQAWESKFARATLAYSESLLKIADNVANKKDLGFLKNQRMPPDSDLESLDSKLHILFSAAKWLKFYADRGHGYEADY